MKTTTEPSAIGVYDDIEQAERTIDELRRAGGLATVSSLRGWRTARLHERRLGGSRRIITM